MDADRWKRIDQLLDAAFEQRPENRPAFLDQACGDDESLKKEIQALLDSDVRARSFIESPAIQRTSGLAAETHFTPDQSIGVYKIVSLLGKGGMGEVYLAQDTRLKRHVAIKLLPPSLSQNPQIRLRFEREARAIASLSHPNICAIYDIGHHNDLEYLVMEFIEGETLSALIQKGALPARLLLDLAVGIADGLAAAHRAGIIHRDLKPGNIMVSTEGRVKILDFGLAKILNTPIDPEEQPTVSAPITRTGIIQGTVPYMSPEQASGKTVDFHSDQFSFGIILYEMATGKRPFARNTAAETLAAIIADEPERISDLSSKISPPLQWLIERCLAKEPLQRYDSTFSLYQQIRDLRDRFSEKSWPTSFPTPPLLKTSGKWMPSRRILLLAISILLATTVMGLWLYFQRLPQREKSIAVLPFTNLNATNETQYFADGLTDDVISQISKIHDLKVVSRTSVMQFRNREMNLREIAKKLGVATILEGSVRRDGNRLRVVGQLIDAETDTHLWTETYDRDLTDIFEIQSDVAFQIAKALQAQLTDVEKIQIEKKPTTNLLAYDYYLKGRRHYDLASIDAACEFFQKAIDLDPRFALAHAWLGDAYLSRFEAEGQEAPVEPAWKSAQKALSIDPATSEAYIVFGRVHEKKGKYTLALEAYLKAQNLDPNYARAARRIGYLYLILGKPDEALRWLRKSIQLDPADQANYAETANAFLMLNVRSKAEEYALKASEVQPEWPPFVLINIYIQNGQKEKALKLFNSRFRKFHESDLYPLFGCFAFYLGQTDVAREYFNKAPHIYDDPLPCYAKFLIEHGRQKEAYTLLDEALKRTYNALGSREKTWTDTVTMAEFHAVRGNREEAYRWLEETIYLGGGGYWAGRSTLPIFDTLHSEKRFQDLVARAKAKAAILLRRAEQDKVQD